MRLFLISDSNDTKIGMRLAGVEGVVAKEKAEVLAHLSKAEEDKDIGIIMITPKLELLCREEIIQFKLEKKRPLLITVPDRHGNLNIAATMEKYVHDAIGISL